MKVFFKAIPSQLANEKFIEYTPIPEKNWFCCKQLKDLDSDYKLWNIKTAEFHFRDINTDGDIAYFPLKFCPLCGEKIEYLSVK